MIVINNDPSGNFVVVGEIQSNGAVVSAVTDRVLVVIVFSYSIPLSFNFLRFQTALWQLEGKVRMVFRIQLDPILSSPKELSKPPRRVKCSPLLT